MQKKITSLYNLKRLKKKDKKIGLCHGVFDLVHFGHIAHFKRSKSFGSAYPSRPLIATILPLSN